MPIQTVKGNKHTKRKALTLLERLKRRLYLAKKRGDVNEANKLMIQVAKRKDVIAKQKEKATAEIYGNKGGAAESVKNFKKGEIPNTAEAKTPATTTPVTENAPKSEGSIDFQYLQEHAEATARTLQASLLHFILVFHKKIHGSDFILKRFHIKIIEKLEKYVFGKGDKPNLYIGLCPRVGKTQIVKYFIAWCYAINPHCNFIATSYGDELANGISEEVMTILEDSFFQTIFPEVKLEIGSKSKGYWKTTSRGEFRAASLRGVITGFGAGNLTRSSVFGGAIIIDDFQKPMKAMSDSENDEIISIFEDTLKSRRNSKDTPFIVIAQRISPKDLIAHISETEAEDWDFFILPALQEDGTSIWEDKVPVAYLQRMKEKNHTLFWAQYQQDPTPIGGDMIKGEWFKYYDPSEDIRFKKMFAVYDTALKKGQEHDFTCGGLFGVTLKNQLFWLDLLHAKLEAPELEASMVLKWNQWQRPLGGRKCSLLYVEDKASGTSIMQNLKAKYGIPVLPIKVIEDKIQRVNDAVPYIASGQVYLPRDANHWISRKVISEVETFTSLNNQKHDDITDVLCHACKIAFRHGGLF